MPPVSKIFDSWIVRPYNHLAQKVYSQKNKICCYNCKKSFQHSRKLTENFEDDSINTDELRLYYYGQEDHVRWFSEGQLMVEFANAGLILHRKKHADFFSQDEHQVYGVNPEEDLLLLYKP